MKNLKKVIALALCFITVFSVMSISVSAASINVGTATTGTKAIYTIQNSGSGKMLNVYGSKSASNTNVTIYASDGTNGQKCKFISNGTMTYNKVTFTKYIIEFACASSCALNVYGSAAANNSNVNIWTKTGNNTQAWIFEYVTSPAKGYIIRSANNPTYVLTANGTSNSSNVCLKTYSSTNKNQVWTCSAFSYANRTIPTTTTASSNNSSTSSKIVSPVENRSTTSSFQPYYRQDVSSSWAHSGIDYVSKNESVYAFCDGKVTATGYNNSVGYYIEIKHTVNNKTFYSYYFHLKKDSTKVSKNDSVSAGTVIAKIGNTGASFGAHLHFQITSGSVINSNGSFHVLPRVDSYKNWSEEKQSQIVSRTSSKNITFYNPEIVLTKGLSIITG